MSRQMILSLPKALIDEFQRSAADVERRKMLLRERFQMEADQEDKGKRKQAKEDRERREWFEAALATAQQLAAFDAKLDRYDAATIDALMKNGRALDRVNERLERLEAEAYVLPDGRRVYPTRKGDEVFDESGARVPRGIIDPDAIPPGHTRWEARVEERQERDRLAQERADQLSFQSKLDATRERGAAGGLSKKDIDDLDAALKADMPESIKRRLPDDRGNRPGVPIPGASTSVAAEPWAEQKQPGAAPAYRP